MLPCHLPSRTAAAAAPPSRGPGRQIAADLATGSGVAGPAVCHPGRHWHSDEAVRTFRWAGARGGVGHSAAGRRVRASSLLQVKGKRQCPKPPWGSARRPARRRAAAPARPPARRPSHAHRRVPVPVPADGAGSRERAVSFPRLGCVSHWPACPHGQLESCYCTLHVAP